MTTKPQKSTQKCAKPRLYKTPRGDYMADKGDGRIVPVVSVGINDYQEPRLALHQIPRKFTELYTTFEATAYQLQFLGAGTSIDLYARSIGELFDGYTLVRDHYIIENGEQELRFYALTDAEGWRNIGGLYGADIARAEISFDEFEALIAGGQNA